MLLQPWDSCTGAECAESTWGSDGDCRGVREVDERNTPIAELRPNSMGGIDGKIPPPTHFIDI